MEASRELDLESILRFGGMRESQYSDVKNRVRAEERVAGVREDIST
jgi:hypothetical protein